MVVRKLSGLIYTKRDLSLWKWLRLRSDNDIPGIAVYLQFEIEFF